MNGLDAQGVDKICWMEFKSALYPFSETSPFFRKAEKQYHSSIQILLGRIRFLGEQLQAKKAQTISTPAPEEK